MNEREERRTLCPIAYMQSDFPTKFGIPRQSGVVEQLRSRVVFTEEYRVREALRGIEEFSHLWLIWGFSEAYREGWSPTVRPPRLGGNTRVGVFASRSPYRPNGLGLSCVRLLSVENGALSVAGADLMDGTPIFDVKPYLPYADARPEARGGFASEPWERTLCVDCPPELLLRLPEEKREALLGILAEDPRPSYQQEDGRVYGFPFAGCEVRFSVAGKELTVISVEEEGK